MGSLTFSEMATIAIIVLIVFGPKRLPELARRGGAMVARLRQASRELRDELRDEYQDTLAPLAEVRDDLKAAKADLTAAAAAVAEDLESADTRQGSAAPRENDADGVGEV